VSGWFEATNDRIPTPTDAAERPEATIRRLAAAYARLRGLARVMLGGAAYPDEIRYQAQKELIGILAELDPPTTADRLDALDSDGGVVLDLDALDGR
jgi:hypothetical protein